jgi:hypothetical protein
VGLFRDFFGETVKANPDFNAGGLLKKVGKSMGARETIKACHNEKIS